MQVIFGGTAQTDTGVTAVAHVIQLSVAPVFLLSAIGAMLTVLTNRLARIVDRARTIKSVADDPSERAHTREEMLVLSRRGALISRSITLCTITALLICAVIAVLFIGAFNGRATARIVSVLFIAAMAAFFAALLFFLREVRIAAGRLHIDLQHSTNPE